MKLKSVRIVPAVRLVGRMPGELHEALTAYTGYYRDVHGEAIEVWPLVVHMLRTFVDDDRAFQTWRRQTIGASAEAEAGPRTGTRTESENGRK